MILRYSRVFSFRYPRALRVYPRIEGNFFSTTRLAFSFFFISPSLYLSSFCVLPPPFQSGSPPVYFVSIQLTGAFPSRCTHSIRSPFFVIVFLSLIYLRFIFPLLLVSVRFFHIYIHVRVWVSRSQPYSCLANEADIFEESLPKIVGSRSCHRGIRLSFEDVHLFHGIRG